jgi:hypothetical protein
LNTQKWTTNPFYSKLQRKSRPQLSQTLEEVEYA